ncbi:MAG: hypothetical protein Q8N96_08265 [Methylovulum sp.]|nr:hypothetical protein [Methylovulum sp.]
MKIELEIDSGVIEELKYIQYLHEESGSTLPIKNDVNDLINYILASVAIGSCKPRSCEREIVQQLRLVVFSHDDHFKERDCFGRPALQ